MLKRKKKRSREFKNSEKVINLEQARIERRKRRSETLEKKQKKGKQSAPEELSERKMSKRNKKRLAYGCVILGIFAVIGMSIFNVYSLQQEYKAIEQVNKGLNAEKQGLQEELGNVNNPEYIEQQARQQLKMVKPGEILYILPQNTSEAAMTRIDAHLLPAGDASD